MLSAQMKAIYRGNGEINPGDSLFFLTRIVLSIYSALLRREFAKNNPGKCKMNDYSSGILSNRPLVIVISAMTSLSSTCF